MKEKLSAPFSACETEKAFILKNNGVFVFLSTSSASKKDFKTWFLQNYSVSILSLSSSLLKGKLKRKKGVLYRTASKKKFFVRVTDPSKLLG